MLTRWMAYNLTLTSVVFELNMVMFYTAPPLYLTLTSVVFESSEFF